MLERLNKALDSIRSNSVWKDFLLYVALKIIIPIYMIAVLYLHARTYKLITDEIGQRSLPVSADATVD